MKTNTSMRLILSIFAFIATLSSFGEAQTLDSTCYTAEDNFYLETPQEKNRGQFRYGGNDYSGGYHDPRFSGMSSYQGTTTGPGPNGGYPGSPRGSYNTHIDYSSRRAYWQAEP